MSQQFLCHLNVDAQRPQIPEAFGALCAALATPLFLVLLGIVLRGFSFVFRSYSTGEKRTQLYWGKAFSLSSSVTPLFLGVVIGAISCDNVIMNHGLSENGFRKRPVQVLLNARLVIEAPHLNGERCRKKGSTCTFPNHKLKTLKAFRAFLG